MIISAVPITGLIRAFNLQNVQVQGLPKNPYADKISQQNDSDPTLYLSEMGTPVLTDLTLQGGSYTTQRGQKISFEDVVLQTVLVNVSQPKRIVTTEIQGRDGTVKEYIGMDDYQVTINGIITGPNGHFPIDEVNALHQICKAPIPIAVISRYLHNLDIFTLVIKDFSYEQQPGAYSLQAFTIECMSDVPVELQII